MLVYIFEILSEIDLESIHLLNPYGLWNPKWTIRPPIAV